MTIRFFVAGVPKAMSVGKSIAFKRKGGATQHFQKRANTEWALMVGLVGREHAPEVPLEGAVSFTATFYLPRPASAGRKVLLPTKRPDVDNLVHKLSDHFNGIFWKDDSQVVDFIVRKRYATPSEPSGVAIQVWTVNA